MTTGAVVVAYQDARVTQSCLESLKDLDDVVVVNVTADSSVAAVVESFGRPVLPVRENVGYGAGVNVGVAALPPEVDVVFFMNADVRLLGIWEEPASADKYVYVPRQRGTDGRPQRTLSSLPTAGAFIREWVLGRSGPSWTHDGRLPADAYANGAAVIAPRSVMEFHPLPEDYFLYWEEAAWFWRLADAGESVFLSHVEVERPSGRLESSRTKSYLIGKNLLRLARERYGRPAGIVYACLGGAWLVRLLFTDALHADRTTRWCMRMYTLRGLLAGLATGSRPEVG